MNRRNLLKSAGQAVAGIAAVGIGVKAATAESPSRTVTFRMSPDSTAKAMAKVAGRYAPDHECNDFCYGTAEVLARQIMRETGEWKEKIRDRRDGRNPIVVTRRGCACCEVTLENGKHDPDWTYRTRQMTTGERVSFRQEYGRSSGFLLCVNITETMRVRGFILNGRIEGWNLSTESDGLIAKPNTQDTATASALSQQDTVESSLLHKQERDS